MSSESQPNANKKHSWDACPSGKLSQLNQQLKSQNHQALAKRRMVVAALFVMILAPATFWITSHNSIPNKELGGITCHDVISHYNAYANNEVDEKLLKQINNHLGNCPMCRKHYDAEAIKKSNTQAFFLNERSIAGLQHFRTVVINDHSQP